MPYALTSEIEHDLDDIQPTVQPGPTWYAPLSIILVLGLLITACSSSSDGFTEDPSLSARLPDVQQVADTLVVAGDFVVEEADPAQDSPLAPHRSQPAGRKMYLLTDEGDGLPTRLDIILYEAGSSAEAVRLWEEVEPLEAHRDRASNVIDREPEDVRERQHMWRFSLDGAGEATRSIGMCLSGWRARGLYGCDLPIWWVSFCSWVLEIGVALSHAFDIDLAELFVQVEALVRDEVDC